MSLLKIQDLHVEVEGKEVLKGVNLDLEAGKVHAIMGRNGSGKTTLSNTLMGHPRYTITKGTIHMDGEDITELSPTERAQKRMFLAFQYPVGIPGVTVANFLRSAIRNVRGEEVPTKEVRKLIKKELKELEIPEAWMTRFINEGFSGGEKKRLEILQMRLLQPKVALLDETDSGLDIDALKMVCENIESMKSAERTFLVITHYQRMLEHVKPDYVHVFMDGQVVKSGDASLALELESQGYQAFEGTK